MNDELIVRESIEGNDPAFQKAVEILDREDDQVIANIFRLLSDASGGNSRWEPKHTTNVLGVLADHLGKVADIKRFEIECNERLLARKQLPFIMGLTFAGMLVLCWLFLYYGKPEFIAAVITGISGFMGGYGLGKSGVEKK